MKPRLITTLTLISQLLLLAGCGGGGGGGGSPPPSPPLPSPAPTFSVSGTVSGLAGAGLALQLNSGAALTISANGAFSFAGPLPGGAAYAVVVQTQPSAPQQTCSVANGSGTIAAANVVNVTVTCATNTYALGGTVSGLLGSGLILLNGTTEQAVTANGSFAFAAPIASGERYDVRVKLQPRAPVQRCTVTNGSGSVAAAAIDSVSVSCAAQYSRFAYAANSDGTVSRYLVDSDTGQLRARGYQTVGNASISNAIAITPDNRFAYITSAVNDSILPHAIDAVTGELRPVQTAVATGRGPIAVAMHPQGRFVYVANVLQGTLSAFAINASGELAEIAGSPYPTGRQPLDLQIDPSGRVLIAVATDSAQVYSYVIDATSGGLTVAAGSPLTVIFTPRAAAIDPAGRFVFVTDTTAPQISVFALDGATGALSAVVGSPFAMAAGALANDVTLDPGGHFLFTTNASTRDLSVFAVNDTTGALSEITGSPFAYSLSGSESPQSISIDDTGRYAYVSAYQDARIRSFAVDPQSGALSPLPRVPLLMTRPGIGALAMTHADRPAVLRPATVFAAGLGGEVTTLNVAANGHLTPAPGGGSTIPNVPQAMPGTLALDPFHRNLFVGMVQQTTIASFSLNANGSLTATGNVPTLQSPYGLGVDPSGRFLYATNENNSSVSQYVIAADGSLVAQSPLAVPAGSRPFGIAVDPTGRFAYAANYSGTVSRYAVDSRTGVLTGAGATVAGAGAVSVAIDPSGQFVYVANDNENTVSAYSINPGDGDLSGQFRVATGVRPIAVTVDPTGRFLYVACLNADGVYAYSIHPLTGVPTLLAGSPFATSSAPRAIAVDPSGRFLYTADFNANVVTIKSIDPATGTLSPVGNASTIASPHGLAVSAVLE
jgi:6-phosphogluconolactonase (cycloisomerase 2 family)